MSEPVFDVAFAASRDAASRCRFSGALMKAYRIGRLRRYVLRLAKELEGGEFFSLTLRDILLKYHRVEVGRYTYGGCLTPGYLPAGSRVGNYSSVSSYMRIYRRNHPTDRLSQHPLFFNKLVGMLKQDSIEAVEDNPLMIGHDVWIGHQTVITPNCRKIGDGAIVGAGSVVTRDVEPFSIVAGNPAKFIKKRFSEDVEEAIRKSEWWLQPISELAKYESAFLGPATAQSLEQLIKLGAPPEQPGGGRWFRRRVVDVDAGFGVGATKLWEPPGEFARRQDEEL